MMSATWITLAVAIIVGITKLLSYLWGDKRRIRILTEKIAKKEKKYAEALAKSDSVAITTLGIRLVELRAQLGSLTH